MRLEPYAVGSSSLLAGLGLLVLISGCSASGDGLGSLPCMLLDGASCLSGDASDNQETDSGPVDPGGEAGSLDGTTARSPLCGVVGCYPGNPSACGAVPATDGASPPIVGDDGGVGDAAEESSDDAPTSPAEASADGATADISLGPRDASTDISADAHDDPASETDAPRDVGAADEPKVQQSCYVKPAASGVVTECAPAGLGIGGNDCTDSSDCVSTFACVEVNQKPVCRPFSCALPQSCPSESFYQLAPLRVAGATRTDLMVPVCLPNDHCVLLSDPESECPSGQVCTVVGSEGETTCRPPGAAKIGETCDDLTTLCAEGLICSKEKNQCLKACHVAAGATECPGGTCQGGNLRLPDGIGICVGVTLDGG